MLNGLLTFCWVLGAFFVACSEIAESSSLCPSLIDLKKNIEILHFLYYVFLFVPLVYLRCVSFKTRGYAHIY